MGNLRSVGKALEKAGASVQVTDSPRAIREAQGVVLPGVGSFDVAAQRLAKSGLAKAATQALEKNKPFLGICLGLQLLFERSDEGKPAKGLGFWKGTVRKFPAKKNLKVPHMGWNTLLTPSPAVRRERVGERAKAVPSSQPSPALQRHKMLQGVTEKDYFYFVHSFYPVPDNRDVIATLTTYGVSFCSSAVEGRVFASQFHPEKSGAQGQRMLRNFVAQLAACS